MVSVRQEAEFAHRVLSYQSLSILPVDVVTESFFTVGEDQKYLHEWNTAPEKVENWFVFLFYLVDHDALTRTSLRAVRVEAKSHLECTSAMSLMGCDRCRNWSLIMIALQLVSGLLGLHLGPQDRPGLRPSCWFRLHGVHAVFTPVVSLPAGCWYGFFLVVWFSSRTWPRSSLSFQAPLAPNEEPRGDGDVFASSSSLSHAQFCQCRALDHRSSHPPACGSSFGCVAPLHILKVIHSQHVPPNTA